MPFLDRSWQTARSLSRLRWVRTPRRRGDSVAGPPADELERQLSELSPADREIVERVLPYTMTGVGRLQALIDGVRYVTRRGIEGDLAECGVWRGGSVMAMILTLQELGHEDRDIHLFDTFEGMTEPTEHDVSPFHEPAVTTWQSTDHEAARPWSELFAPEQFGEESVRSAIAQTGYPADRIHFVRGDVAETIPAKAPDSLALLRLDTDWYASTRHELEHLYPRLSRAGVLIVDDYGHWEGSARAVDEYFASAAAPLLLQRSDYTGRMAVKA